MSNWVRLRGVVQRGHGVASDGCRDPRFPGGTIQIQKPLFKERGCNLDAFHSGTINLCIAPLQFSVKGARFRFENLRWTAAAPAEDFSLMDCMVILNNGRAMEGVVYYPHPETKPEHFHAPDIIEIITYHIAGLKYGDSLAVDVDSRQIAVS